MLFILAVILAVASALQLLPPVRWQSDGNVSFSLPITPKNVYLESRFAQRRDEYGLTLIPPSALEFAQTFITDLNAISNSTWQLHVVDFFPEDQRGIFLGKSTAPAGDMVYENGDASEEGYELEIREGSVYITGSGARGMWWGTRTFIQQLIMSENGELPAGRVLDTPAYPTRGYMLDCGRKYYSADFLKDLCTYASFFKMSEFQYHLMDNYPLNRGRNDTWNKVYSHFALIPEKNHDLDTLVERRNESLSRAQFEDLQQHCASRGVTIVPEIESPGHLLVITKWKPELALAKKDLLNLTHPDAIPTVKSIWDEFLPWFKTKEVHVGADEYDPKLADDYLLFVNEMNNYIQSISEKRIRIWGTDEPSETITILRDIIIQHWQYGQSDPAALEPEGYSVINSEDWVTYVTLKNDHTPIRPARYPQWYNITRSLNFADRVRWQWEPSLYDPYNTTEQVRPGAKRNKGAIMAAWNDNGPDATTQLEAFYSIREGMPVLAARAWSGTKGDRLEEQTLMDSIRILTHNAPGQNLDRRIAGERLARERGSPLLDWERRDTDNQTVKLGYGSKGLNHELILNVTGPFTLSSNDSILSLSEDGTLTYTSDNWPYPLRHVDERDGFDPGHPGRIWTNTSSSSHEQVKVPLQCKITIRTDFLGGSRVWINDKFAGRFEVFIFGGRNTLFSWSQMAFVAPLDVVQGGIRRLTINPCESAAPPVPPSSPAGPNPPTSTGLAPGHSIPAVQVLLVFLLLQLLTLPGAESI